MCVRLLCFCAPQSTMVIALTLSLTRAKQVIKEKRTQACILILGRMNEEDHEVEINPSCRSRFIL